MYEREPCSQVLENFSIPEALCVVYEIAVRLNGIADIPYACISDGGGQELLKAADSGCGSVEILGVTSGAPRVEVGLQNLRSKIVVVCAGLDEETVLIEESEVIVRDGLAGVVSLVREVGKRLHANTRTKRHRERYVGIGEIEIWTYAVLA